jgi:cytochrome bd-type quinol oxidase subunit 2
MLILLIAMGWAIVNEANLGENRRKVQLFTILYLFISGMQQLISAYLREGVVDADSEIYLSFISMIAMVVALSFQVGLYIWIVHSLYKTVNKLKQRNQDAKLKMYQGLTVVISIFGILSVCVLMLEASSYITDSEDKFWKVWWFFEAYWAIAYLLIILSLSSLWRPAKNNTRYAFVARDDDDIDMDELDYDLDAPTDSMMKKRKVDTKNTSINSSFDDDDDDEGDVMQFSEEPSKLE